MRVEGVSTIAGLDAEALPPEGLSVNVDSGELSYCVDGQGATIRLTVDDALTVARALLEFARRIDGPVAEVIDLEAWRSGE